MSYVSLFAVYYEPDNKSYTVNQVNDYKKKAKAVQDLDPKPIELADRRYVVYVWSLDAKSATLKANEIYERYFRKPVE